MRMEKMKRNVNNHLLKGDAIDDMFWASRYILFRQLYNLFL